MTVPVRTGIPFLSQLPFVATVDMTFFAVFLFVAPWITIALGAISVFFWKKNVESNQRTLADQNQMIMEMLKDIKQQTEEQKTSEVMESGNKPEKDNEMCKSSAQFSSAESTSSGYSSTAEKEVDWDYELFKISVAPTGPVPDSQVLLTVTCPINKQYVKAITDEEQSIVEIWTFAPEAEDTWQWKRAECKECLEKIEESLVENGCVIPFADEEEETAQIETMLLLDSLSDDEQIEMGEEEPLEDTEFDFSNLQMEYDYYGL